MRLAFIANGLSYGGAEKMIVFVAVELFKRGHSIAIFNTNAHKGVSQRIPQGVTVYNADITTKNKRLAYYKRLLFCIQCAREFKPDAMVGFLMFPNLYSVITGKILRIPSVISERADPYVTNANNTKLEQLLLKLLCSSDGAVFQTTGASMFYPLKLRSRSAIIPNAIAITKEYKSKDYAKRDKIIVSLGRLDNYQKRLDVLIDAFEQFHLSHSEYIMHIYGSGPDKGFAEKMIEDKHLSDSVKLMGVSNNSFEAISTGKIFAITSDYEGISNSLLEAMAVGMPVVSTDHSPGGARFLIKDGENGLLTPVGDSSMFASALCRFADDESFALECGNRAVNVLKDFAPNVIIDKWEEYLISLTGQHRKVLD